MRILGLVGVVIALALIGLLAKKQLAVTVPAVLPASAGAGVAPPLPVQPQQVRRQVQQALDAAAAQRKLPDEAQ